MTTKIVTGTVFHSAYLAFSHDLIFTLVSLSAIPRYHIDTEKQVRMIGYNNKIDLHVQKS